MATTAGTHRTYFLVQVETTLDVKMDPTLVSGYARASVSVVGDPEVTTYLLPPDVGENARLQFEEARREDDRG